MVQASSKTEFVGLVEDSIEVLSDAFSPDVDQRLEFTVVAGENKPFYVGQAPPNSATSATVWTIQRYTWVAAPNGTGTVPSEILTRVGAWDARATLF